MIVVGFDIETNGVDPQKDAITELGYIVMDTDGWRVLDIYDSLICGVEVSEKITEITGIDNAMLLKFGVPIEIVMSRFLYVAKNSDMLIAHNGYRFDRPFVRRVAVDCGFEFPEIPLLDTMTDIRYPQELTNRKLDTIAKYFGILNQFAHRAIFDVIAMMEIVKQNINDPAPFIEIAKAPYGELIASDRNAKNFGFYWRPEDKTWRRSCRVSNSNYDMEGLPFKCAFVARSELK